jgi:uncharacterized protein (TIGR02145 family)
MKNYSKFYLLITVALILIILISCKKNNENDQSVIKDGDGNIYTAVSIGSQTWIKENLKTTKYNDGTIIPYVTNTDDWKILTTPAYCWYNNDPTYKGVYGGLYNWYAVNTNKLCPDGWHVPSDTEWETLTDYLGGSELAGGKLKEFGTAHWSSPNTSSTNETGFTALPGGYRYHDGVSDLITYQGFWWSSTGNGPDYAWHRYMSYAGSNVSNSYTDKKKGLSVRCIRN